MECENKQTNATSKSTWRIDTDSTDNNVQPFKNWPSRHSSKM